MPRIQLSLLHYLIQNGIGTRHVPNIGNLVDTGYFSPYSRETAVYPLPYLRERKFWPSVARVDDGMRFCSVLPIVYSHDDGQLTEI